MNPQAQATPVTPDIIHKKRLGRSAAVVGGAIAVLLLAALGALAWYLTHPAAGQGNPAVQGGPSGPGGGRGAPASTVGVATAERASVPVFLEALGTVTPQASVKVRPQVSGVLEKVLFQEGQMVRAGQLLATIDPRQFEMALMQAAGQRQRDEAQLDSAKVTLQRYKTLLEQDSIARQDVDSQAALVKQLEGTVVIDKAAEGTARLNLGYTRVVAPVSGRVGLRVVDVGNVVNSGDAAGLVLITQVAPIDVVFAIPQDQAGELQQSAASPSAAAAVMKVTAMDRTRSTVLETGVFASLDNQVDTTTGTVKAKARFANSKLALFPSQFVNVQLLVKTIENAVVVPVTALRLGSTGDYVYVLNAAERTVSLRLVKRGQATVDKIVISSGLQAGERVITEGADRLKDGARVLLAGDQPRVGGGGRRQGASAAQGNMPTAAGEAARPAGAASRAMAAPAFAPSAMSPERAAQAPERPAYRPAVSAAPVSSASPPGASDGPSPEQRLRMLDQVKDDPVALERRKHFFEKLDSGDAGALERWRSMMQKREQPAQ